MEDKKQATVFEILSGINVNDKVEKKNGLTYLSWPWAWGTVKKLFPDASYVIGEVDFDPDMGFMCHTSVTIEGETISMWLPVMDGANKAMKKVPYTYFTKQWEGGRKIDVEKEVQAATMFDINKTIMRCLVKNLAMFGLGLYIFAGEDLPEGEGVPAAPAAPAATPPPAAPQEPKAETKLPSLKVDSEAWGRASAYVKDNKSLGLDGILKQLKRKYSIPLATKKKIEELIGAGQEPQEPQQNSEPQQTNQ